MKKYKEQKIIRRQVSKKLNETGPFFFKLGSIPSWSAYIRLALGMSISQLAARLGKAQASVSELEKRERGGNITVNKLKEMADAMECEFRYCFVPRDSIMQIVSNQAKQKAMNSIAATDTHMALEDQLVQTDFEERFKILTDEMKYSKYLWDNNE